MNQVKTDLCVSDADTEVSDTEVVKKIFQDQFQLLESQGRPVVVFKDWVVLRIQEEFPHVRLYNKIYNYKDDRSDGVTENCAENLRRGAEKVYRDAIKGLKKSFLHIDLDKRTIRPQSEVAFPPIPSDPNEPFLFEGKVVYISDLAEKFGLSKNTIWRRITTNGWSVKKAVTTPLEPKKKQKNAIHTLLLSDIESTWMSRSELSKRFRKRLGDDFFLKRGKSRLEVLKRRKHRPMPPDTKEDLINLGLIKVLGNHLSILKKESLIEIKDRGTRIRRL